MAGRSNPSSANAATDLSVLEGLVFKSAPTVKKRGGGAKAKAMDPVIAFMLEAMLTGKFPENGPAKFKNLFNQDAPLVVKEYGARWDGTNGDFIKVLSDTVSKWEKAYANTGVVVKVKFETVEGNRSVKAEDKDEQVAIRYSLMTPDEIKEWQESMKRRTEKRLAATPA